MRDRLYSDYCRSRVTVVFLICSLLYIMYNMFLMRYAVLKLM